LKSRQQVIPQSSKTFKFVAIRELRENYEKDSENYNCKKRTENQLKQN